MKLVAASVKFCPICGSRRLKQTRFGLWPSLVAEWQLAGREVDYINRQQGLRCRRCKNNLRSMALAVAIMRCYGQAGLFKDFVRSELAQTLRVLEVNEADALTAYLRQMQGHTLQSYPAVDLMRMPFDDESLDLIVHSDTLEHVADPVMALSESRRVLSPGGYCCFTIPLVVDRLTRSRDSLPPSFHGRPEDRAADFLVHTEYGADAWKQVIEAGFDECRIISLEYPAAQAIVAARIDRAAPPDQGLASRLRRWLRAG